MWARREHGSALCGVPRYVRGNTIELAPLPDAIQPTQTSGCGAVRARAVVGCCLVSDAARLWQSHAHLLLCSYFLRPCTTLFKRYRRYRHSPRAIRVTGGMFRIRIRCALGKGDSGDDWGHSSVGKTPRRAATARECWACLLYTSPSPRDS